MRAFKRHYFGREDVLLHTVDMGRGEGDYAFLNDAAIREDFYADLNALLSAWAYQVVACVVKKPELVARYGVAAADPYMYSLHELVDRFCLELGEDLDGGFVCAEKRNPRLDGELMDAWERLRTEGTRNTTGPTVDRRIVGLDLRDKKPNLAGLQLADLVITPIGRHVAGRPAKSAQVQWRVVETKLRGVGNRSMGHGLVIRP